MSPATGHERASSPSDLDSDLDIDIESAPLIAESDAAARDGPFARTPWNSGIDWDQFRGQHWEQEGPRLFWKRAALVILIPVLFYVAYSLSKRPFHDPGWRPDGEQH
ncbi:hypothetical protein AURDEDRAFT_179756 [Auricularia subglabra TFB-10046 SS5]|nr:hypothetical protein AURDEDRAFT_179756 [Auricularia subglabra TFB-10046 SS5]